MNTMYRTVRTVLTVGAIAFGTVSAQASAVLTGTFSGTAKNSRYSMVFSGVPPISFDGTPISGTFRIDASHCQPIMMGPLTGDCVQFGSTLSGKYAYGSFVFNVPTTLIQVVDTPTSQTLNVTFAFTDPYSAAYLSLTGKPNAFLDGTDYANLHPGTFDLSTASLGLYGGREFAATVALTSFRFDQVPEPAGWMPLAAGLGIAGVGLARRRTMRRHRRVAA